MRPRAGALSTGIGAVAIVVLLTFPVTAAAASPLPPFDEAHGSIAPFVTIDAAWGTVDAGVPFVVAANLSGITFPPTVISWSDSFGDQGIGPVWKVTPPFATEFTVTLVVYGANGSFVVALRGFTSVPLPTVSFNASAPAADVGVTVPATVDIAGGVPPYNLTWAALTGGPEWSATFSSPGLHPLPIVADRPGLLYLEGTVTDRWGARAATTAEMGAFYPMLQWGGIDATRFAELGSVFNQTGWLEGGAPPVTYSITTNATISDPAPSYGSTLIPSAITWSAEFESVGNATVAWSAVDAAGIDVRENVSVTVVPSLDVTAEAYDTPDGEIGGLNVSIVGGVPPYVLTVSIGSSVEPSWSIGSAGAVAWTPTGPFNATAGIGVLVLDHLGYRATASVTGALPASHASSPPPPVAAAPRGDMAPWVIGAAIVGGAAFLFLTLRRRLRAPTSSARADSSTALETVRRLLEGAGPVDAETASYLATEEGISDSEFSAARAHWRRLGHIRSGPNESGGESLEWVSNPTPTDRSSGEAEP